MSFIFAFIETGGDSLRSPSSCPFPLVRRPVVSIAITRGVLGLITRRFFFFFVATRLFTMLNDDETLYYQ